MGTLYEFKREREICTEPSIGEKVYDYFNGALGAREVRIFERHMINCPCCEKTILDLDRMLLTLVDEQSMDPAITTEKWFITLLNRYQA